MFQVIKTWDNRESRRVNGRLTMRNGRSWTRRIQWLEDSGGVIKLKFDEGDSYTEVGVPVAFAQTVWDRFKGGQSAEDAISLFRVNVKPSRKLVQRAKHEGPNPAGQ